MQRPAATFIQLLLCASLTLSSYSQDSHSGQDLKGSVVGENVYVNPALGMKITLPGSWELLPPGPTQSHPPSDCTGPLCGNPEINLVLQTKADSSPADRVFLAGYRLSPEYLNRDRAPLSRFAEVMLAGSLGGSGLVPIGTQSAIQLDGKLAYRLLAGKAGETAPKIIGYVSEANGYVFMLVLAAPSSSPQALQSAIESMELGASTRDPDAVPARVSKNNLVSHGFSFDDREWPMCELSGSEGACHVEAFVYGEKAPTDEAAHTCTKLDKASYVGHCAEGNLDGLSLVIADGSTKEGKEAFISYFVDGRIAYPALTSYLVGNLNFGMNKGSSGYGCVYFGKWDMSAERCGRFMQIYGADLFSESNAQKLRDGTFDLNHYRTKFLDFVRDNTQPKH